MTLEQTLALNPFSKREGKEPEKEKKVELEVDETVERIFEGYKKLRDTREYNELKEGTSKLEVLKPAQIDKLLQWIRSETPRDKVENWITGDFLTGIIQDSYDAGYNDFVLTTADTEINEMGNGLEGTEENPIKLDIKGIAGYRCGDNSKNSEFNIEGNVEGNCGSKSKNSTFNIKGDA
ncbi:unnamed protein product, partial [marine sediment metagenome]